MILAELAEAVRLVAWHLAPFILSGAAIAGQLGLSQEDSSVTGPGWGEALQGKVLPRPAQVFPRLEVEANKTTLAAARSSA